MTTVAGTTGNALALSAGFSVVADDGAVGEVETPLFPPDRSEPDFLIVRVRARLRVRYPVVPAALVAGVDRDARVVRVRGPLRQIADLPEHLPLAT